EETLAWVEREMTSPEGAFYSTLDADSEGHEGKFYVWSEAEIRQALIAGAFDAFAYVYNVSPEVNWEGTNILHRTRSLSQDARLLGMEMATLSQQLETARQQLLRVRERRIRPGLDDKVLTSWNALMINAFACAAQVLDAKYLPPATNAATFLW